MDDIKIANLDPTRFYRGSSERPTTICRDATISKFRRFYAPLRNSGSHNYDLNRIASACFYFRSLLLRSGVAGTNKAAVEIGCGSGNKAFAIHDLFKSYIAIDVDADQISAAVARSDWYGDHNIDFICGNAVDVLKDDSIAIDVLILYAVIEHLTLSERSLIIQLAETVIEKGGSVIVMESPNRLIPFDSHTSGLHFFNWLPDALANGFAKQLAKRETIRDGLCQWGSDEANTALYRYGRGVSFHDFSLNLRRPLSQWSFLADSYEVEMLNVEPSTFQEVALFGYLKANLADVYAPAFSRCWVDFIAQKLENETIDKTFLSPHWPKWLSIDRPPAFYDPMAIQLNSRNSRWVCELDEPRSRDLTVMWTAPGHAGRFSVFLNNNLSDEIDTSDLHRSRPTGWHLGYAVRIELAEPIRSIRIELAAGSSPINFQGCVASSSLNVEDRQ